MNTLAVQLRLRRGDFALDAEWSAPARGVTALFGPSGAGKTTLLRAIAGLERGMGMVKLARQCWQDDARGLFVPPSQRGLGVVFQDAHLFTHLSVRGNLEYGWRRVTQRPLAFEAVVESLDLGPLLTRRPAGLSGGERQRVALGRALLAQPCLLLLDEPLAALDRERRDQILPYLERLPVLADIPIVYVTHALDEVVRLADHMVLLDAGRVSAQGPLTTLLARPDLPLARRDDAGAVLEVTVAGHDEHYHLAHLHLAGQSMYVTGPAPASGARLRVQIHARDVSLALAPPTPSTILNVLRGTVSSVTPASHAGQVMVGVQVGEQHLLARITRKSADQLPVQPGLTVYAQIKSVALVG